MSARAPRLLRSWSLRRRLVVGVAALVAVALFASGVATLVALRSSLFERLDEEVLVGLELVAGPDLDAGGPDGGGGPGQRVGTLQVVLGADGTPTTSSYVGADGTQVSLTSNQLAAVEAAGLAEREPVTVDLGGTLGTFRLAAEVQDGVTVVSGVSMAGVTATSSALVGILAVVMGVVLLLVAGAIGVLVTAALRPLERVAATAERVAMRPLSEGSVSLPERVGAADDPTTEVGRVATSLDTLLSHVESALVARQRSEERLRRFIADASHELRTPLASIRGYAQLSQREAAPMTATQERSLDRIASEAARLGELVEDLLLLARLDAGQPLQRESVDLALLVIDAISDAHAADATRTWLVEVDESVEVTGDENRLRQVIANLLGNARVHTPEGTTVRAGVCVDDTHARVFVIDDGPGIPADLQERLFERFVRGDAARTRTEGSTGLGLSISEAIVAAHGGELTVESMPGRTTFTAWLPR